MRRPERPRSDPPPSSDRAPPRRDRGAAATQERILDAAEAEFAARGFAGARLREIASAAAVQPALIHHYFADKQGLYEAVIGRAVEQMSTASWRVLQMESGLEGIVRGFIDVMVDFSTEHQRLFAIMRAELASGSGTLAEIVREKSRPILDAVAALAHERQAAGELRRDLDAGDMVLAGLSLILYPIVDATMLAAVLPDAERALAVDVRKRVIFDVLMRGISR